MLTAFLKQSLPALALACATAMAAPPAAAGTLIDINVIDARSADYLREYTRRGETWIEGRPGQVYSVQLVNRSPERVLVVLSVDGINAITGDRAAYNQSGYVLEPYQTTEISGWRKSLQHAAEFYFTSVPDSYAARTGRPDDIGVIGAAVFREKTYRPQPVYAPAPIAGNAAPQARRPMAEAADSAMQRIGTGHGEVRYAPVSRTGFERASRAPAEVVALRYDRRDRLVALGILPRRSTPYEHAPRPFAGFVPDPPR